MKMIPGGSLGRVTVVALSVLLASPGRARAQEPPPAKAAADEAFPAEVEQVTVDAVVVDKRGDPVTGLTKDDFTVAEEGRPQTVSSFDVVKGPVAVPASGSSGIPDRPLVGTNTVKTAERGRLFVIVFDNVHMSPLNARRAKAAVAAFLEKGVQDGDRVLLLDTGGEAWWSTRIPRGRADLLAVLKHIDGRRILDSALERLTDYEAIQISVYRDTAMAARVQSRLDQYGTSSRQGMQQSQQQQSQTEIVPSIIDAYVESRANEAYGKLRARQEITLGVLERCFRALADSRERKAVVLVSEGFAYDSTNPSYRKAAEAARRANVALYFVDTRGLETMSSFYNAEFGDPIDEKNLMSAIADVSNEGEGAVSLSSDTGGFSVRNTNDFAAGMVRIGQESSSYYLIGYTPGPIPHDGRFRKIDVRVRRKGLTVRARKGYYAPGPGPTLAANSATPSPSGSAATRPSGARPELQYALDNPGSLDAVPLRMTAFVLEPTDRDKASVTLAAEADVSKVLFGGAGGNAVLDTLLVLTHRESGELQRSDLQVVLERKPGAPPPAQPIWYSFVRPFQLKAGTYQAKLVVHEAAAQRTGSLLFEFEVPALDRLRVSTPILSDALPRSAGGTSAPPLLVRRTFASGGVLYCRFDVYGGAPGPGGKAAVKAGHELRRRDGTSLGRSAPRLIEPTSIGALARLIQLPLNGIAPGDYELVINVNDEVAGQSRQIVQPFTVAPSVATASQ